MTVYFTVLHKSGWCDRMWQHASKILLVFLMCGRHAGVSWWCSHAYFSTFGEKTRGVQTLCCMYFTRIQIEFGWQHAAMQSLETFTIQWAHGKANCSDLWDQSQIYVHSSSFCVLRRAQGRVSHLCAIAHVRMLNHESPFLPRNLHVSAAPMRMNGLVARML